MIANMWRELFLISFVISSTLALQVDVKINSTDDDYDDDEDYWDESSGSGDTSTPDITGEDNTIGNSDTLGRNKSSDSQDNFFVIAAAASVGAFIFISLLIVAIICGRWRARKRKAKNCRQNPNTTNSLAEHPHHV